MANPISDLINRITGRNRPVGHPDDNLGPIKSNIEKVFGDTPASRMESSVTKSSTVPSGVPPRAPMPIEWVPLLRTGQQGQWAVGLEEARRTDNKLKRAEILHEIAQHQVDMHDFRLEVPALAHDDQSERIDIAKRRLKRRASELAYLRQQESPPVHTHAPNAHPVQPTTSSPSAPRSILPIPPHAAPIEQAAPLLEGEAELRAANIRNIRDAGGSRAERSARVAVERQRRAFHMIENPDHYTQAQVFDEISKQKRVYARAERLHEVAKLQEIVPEHAIEPPPMKPPPKIPFEEIAGETAYAAKGEARAVTRAAARAPSRMGAAARRAGGFLAGGASRMGGLAKGGLLGLAVLGGAAIIANSARRDRREASARDVDDAIDQAMGADLPKVLKPEDLNGPAEGRGEFEWRNRINASRGGLDQQRGNPGQPRMSVVPEANVQDLNAPAMMGPG